MCGVIGLIGDKRIYDSIKEGLQALEYRGYDSSGLLISNQNIQKVFRHIGSSKQMSENPVIDCDIHDIVLGLGHNRWATHGNVCIENTHPIENDYAFLVHNGVVENTQDLVLDNVKYIGNTDTEKVLYFFTYLLKIHTPKQAMEILYNTIKGMSAFIFVLKSEPEKFYFMRKGLNPLYLSQACKPNMHVKIGLCSDANVLERWFDTVYTLQDGQYGFVNIDEIQLFNDDKTLISQQLKTAAHSSEKTHKTWLRTEIDQQSVMIGHTLHSMQNANLILNKKYDRYCFIGCGSAYYAGCIAKQWSAIFGIDAMSILASEFYTLEPLLDLEIYQNTLFIFISQSGETLETIEAAHIIKEKNYDRIGIVNTVNSSLCQYMQKVLYINAGVENSVASTKSFTAQLVVLGYLLSRIFVTLFGEAGAQLGHTFIKNIEELALMFDNIKVPDEIINMCTNHKNIYFLSKGLGIDICNEVALKVQELAYINTHTSSASEFKHGPLALVDESFLAIVFNPECGAYDRLKANVMEIVARNGKVIVVTDNIWAETHPNITFCGIHSVNLMTMPFVYIKWGQELAYHCALQLGYNVDYPRNLVKSVTVV